MPSTYSPSLRLELIGAGEQAANWGNTTNYNLGTLLEQAIAGVQSVAVSGASYTLTTGSGVADEARNAVLVLTGTLAASCNVIVPTADKTYTFRNATTGGFSVVVKTAAGSGVTIANGFTQQVYCDATNVVAAGVPFNAATNTITTNVSGNVAAGAGSAAAPSVTFGDTDTGIYGPAAGQIGFSTNGAFKCLLDENGNFIVGGGSPLTRFTASNPSITGGAPVSSGSAADPNVVVRSQAGSVVLDTGVLATGTIWLQARAASNYTLKYPISLNPDGGNVIITGQLQSGSGTAAAPAYSFSGDTDTGIYLHNPNVIGFSIGGVKGFEVTPDAVVLDSRVGSPNATYFARAPDASATNARGVGFIALNESSVPVASTGYSIATDGSGNIELYATPAGSRASDRRVLRATVPGSGPIALVGPVNVSSGDLDVAGNLRFNSGYGSAALAYGVRAWVNFNGIGTVAIRASGGVTSITDNATGDYTVNFNFTMPDANYCPQLTASKSKGSGDTVIAGYISNDTPPSTTGFRFYVTAANFANSVMEDSLYMNVLVVR